MLGDVRRPAVADVALERLLLGGDDTGLDHRLRDVRTDDRGVAGDLADAFERDRQPEVAEPLDHQLAAAVAILAQPPELELQGGVLHVHPVAQDVHARAEVLGRELDPGDDLDAGLEPGRERLGQAVRRVVVGQRDDVQVAFGGKADHLGRGEGPVGAVRVRVQVDARHADAHAGRRRRTPSRTLDVGRGDVPDRPRAGQHHRVLELRPQDAEHVHHALLARGREPPTRGAPHQHRGGAEREGLEDVRPRRNPPSTSTGTRPSTASTISGRTVIGAWTESSCRPPWFETTIASTPASTASRASSAVMRPLTSNGTGAASRIHARSSHVRSGAYVSSSDGRPIGIWKPLRVSRWRSPLSGKSTVRQTAPNPAAWTRRSMSTVSSAVGEHVQLPPFRRVGGGRHVLQVLERGARDHHDGPRASGGARGGELAVGMRALLVRPRCHQHRERDLVTQDRGRRVGGPGAGQHPRADHPVLERPAVLRQRPLVPRTARVVVEDVRGQDLPRQGLVVVDRHDLRRVHGAQPSQVRAARAGPR